MDGAVAVEVVVALFVLDASSCLLSLSPVATAAWYGSRRPCFDIIPYTGIKMGRWAKSHAQAQPTTASGRQTNHEH